MGRHVVDVVTLRDVLGSFDSAHGDLVYSMLFLRYLETGIFERIDLRKARKCRKLCFCYFKLKRELLPMLADYTCVLLAGLAKNEIAETGKHPIYDEAERMIWRLSMRHVWKIQTAPVTTKNMFRTFTIQWPGSELTGMKAVRRTEATAVLIFKVSVLRYMRNT